VNRAEVYIGAGVAMNSVGLPFPGTGGPMLFSGPRMQLREYHIYLVFSPTRTSPLAAVSRNSNFPSKITGSGKYLQF